jgi:hypothetical protein
MMSAPITKIAAMTATVVVFGTYAAPAVDASDDIAINGTYTAFSDGQWAQTDQSYHDEASVTQTWTITSTCTTFQDCTGRVMSDQGWSADLVFMSGRWKVARTVDNWETCADGTAVPGQQAFTFWRSYPDRQLVGWDQTIGPSGGCGFNKWLNVTMPFRLTPVG